MFVRRGPAIVLSLVLGAAALFVVPSAAWSDGGNATDVQKQPDSCGPGTATRAKLKVGTLEDNSSRLLVVGIVWSDDSDVWSWRFKHNGNVSDEGMEHGNESSDRSFKVTRTMINFFDADDIVFRAENMRTGEVCRATISY